MAMKFAKATQNRNRNPGFTLIEAIMATIFIALFAFLLLPAMAKQKASSKRMECVSNLKKIGLSFRVGSYNDGSFPMTSSDPGGTLANANSPFSAWRHFQAISNELEALSKDQSGVTTLVCPSDTRKAAVSWSTLRNTNISYFVCLQAAEIYPKTLLAGDRNITNGLFPTNGFLDLKTNLPAGWTRSMHRSQGNAVLGDGSVQQLTNERLTEQIRHSGIDETLRIALPE